PIHQYSWEIIEGGADHDESALAAAQRELEEEAGIKAREWFQLGEEYHLSNCFSSEVGVLFLARNLESVPMRPEGTEVLELRKMPIEQAIAMVDSGEIKDGLSIIGLLRAERFLAGNRTITAKRL